MSRELTEFIQRYYVDRRDTDSLKWDALGERYGDPELLPLWVADMDFSVPESVKNILRTKVDQGIFGYATVPKDYFTNYQLWQSQREGTPFQKEWLFFSTGVVQSLYDLIDCFTEVNDGILVQTPVYYPFFNSIQDKKRRLVVSPLLENNGFEMDLRDLEEKIVEEKVKMFILCSPHNPVGRVWNRNELIQLFEICHRHQVLVIADEIHSDLILPGHTFVSAASLSAKYWRNLIICNAPSKTFNLASLLNSHVWIPDERNRERYHVWTQAYKQTENSSLGQLAASAAYKDGSGWLANVLKVVEVNYLFVKNALSAIPEIKVADLQGTYLLWLDLSGLGEFNVKELVQDRAKLAIDYGEWFSAEHSRCIRLNLATRPENIQNAVKQLIKAVKTVQGGE